MMLFSIVHIYDVLNKLESNGYPGKYGIAAGHDSR